MSYATYDSYRDSGVVWLGDVPSHWEVKRLKFLIDYIQTGSTPPSSQQEYYSSEDVDWYNPSDFNDDSLLLKNPSKKISQIAVDDNVVKKLPNQSILIIGIGATLGKVGLVEKSCSTNQQINAIVTNKYCRPKFIAYALFVQRDIMKLISSSATLSIMNQEKTKSLILAVPSFEEQTAIVTYLDSQLSQIDALIGKQQSLLEKLAEQRTATITQAVTKGLNPDVLMKDSGVAWLGEVPSHWEVKRLRFTIQLNPVKSELNLSDETLVSFVPMEAVNFDKNLTLNQEKPIDEVYKGYTYFCDDDVVFAKITPCFENGKSAIAKNLTNGVAFGTTELHVLRANNLLNNQFLYYLIKSDLFMKTGEAEMYGAGGQKRVPENFIKNFVLGFPPLTEQTAIANYLDEQTADIDRLSDTVRQTIDRLQEYRSTLITQVVTGKIKVV